MRRLNWTILVALVLAGVALSARSAAAAPITTKGRPLAPALGFARPRNTYLLVWAEDKNLGTGLDLYAARTTSSGIVVGSEVPLVVAPGDQSDPTLIYSERLGNYLVMFTSTGLPSGGGEATPGVPPPPGATATPPGFPTPPPPPPPIPFKSGGVSGEPDQPDQPPPPPPGVATSTPGVPPPSSGNNGRDIYGTWATESGQRITSVFSVISSPADDTYPALAYRPPAQGSAGDERYVLVWREVNGTTVGLSDYEFVGGFGYFFTYDSAKGNIVGGGDQGRPTVATEISGGYLVTWAETPKGANNRDILGRRLNLNAWPIGPILTLVNGPTDQVYPSVGAVLSSGGYLLAWEERAVGAPPDIRIRRLNRNGIPIQTAYDIAGGPPFSFAPTMPSSDRSTFLLGWLDRNAASDLSIVGAEITRDGRQVGPQRILVQGGTGPGALTPVPPPGFPTPPPPPPPIP